MHVYLVVRHRFRFIEIVRCREIFSNTNMIHDGGGVAVELSRVVAGSPQLITIGAVETGGNKKDSHYLYICPLAFALAHIVSENISLHIHICH